MNMYQFPMGKVKAKKLAKQNVNRNEYQFPMGKVEELSKSSIWHTTPMQQRSKSGFIRDWLSATAKGDKYQCTFHYRTSIPYGKGKGDFPISIGIVVFLYQFPMGKVKILMVVFGMFSTVYQFPMGKVKHILIISLIAVLLLYQFPMGKVKSIIILMIR